MILSLSPEIPLHVVTSSCHPALVQGGDAGRASGSCSLEPGWGFPYSSGGKMQWTERGVQWHGDLGEMGETNEENCQPQLREPSPPGKGSYQGDVSGNKSLRYQGQPENTTILYLSRSPSCYNNWDEINRSSEGYQT